VEFEEYCSNIRKWASQELNIYIPKPNEVVIEDNLSFTYIQK
jgi:hypothetical protein